jgi:hypothetical protein
MVAKLLDRPEWVYELKLDGYRAQEIRDEGDVRVLSRNAPGYYEAAPSSLRMFTHSRTSGSALKVSSRSLLRRQTEPTPAAHSRGSRFKRFHEICVGKSCLRQHCALVGRPGNSRFLRLALAWVLEGANERSRLQSWKVDDM